jgi:hypothetical protein
LKFWVGIFPREIDHFEFKGVVAEDETSEEGMLEEEDGVTDELEDEEIIDVLELVEDDEELLVIEEEVVEVELLEVDVVLFDELEEETPVDELRTLDDIEDMLELSTTSEEEIELNTLESEELTNDDEEVEEVGKEG